ncbi:hypothetical protein XENOCAPTIV_000322, partial [Xenoophorus captivus]
VPIQFWQHGVADLRLHTEVKAVSELDYACDEPTLPPYITLTVKGAGSSEVTADMNFFKEYNKLYYENFIYIAATHTFSQYEPLPALSMQHCCVEQPGPEQQFINQKMRPGSGVLSVQVLPDGPTRVLQVLVNLEEGLGVSLVNKVPEELVFTTMSGVDVHFTHTAANEVLELSIQNIQLDNQLLGTTQPVMLCVTPSSGDSGANDSGPALQVNAVKVPSKLMLTELFKDTGPHKHYYFENLKISLPQIKLSVLPSHKLPPDLKEIIINDILKHFREVRGHTSKLTDPNTLKSGAGSLLCHVSHLQELMSQAAQILGSVDFLGNPMGLLNDVTEGVSELIKYGNVSGTLSDGLGKTMDTRHQSEREYIRYHGATSGEHLVAGIHGLAHGIIGGMTSIITSTVEGVKTEGGVSGFFSGLGKGLVGTVTKPVVGALDFASETAQTVRDITSLIFFFSGLLKINQDHIISTSITFTIHPLLYGSFIAVEPIDTYCVLISSKVVYFLKPGDYVDREGIFLEVKYDDLYHCLVSKDHGKVYVQLTKKAENTSSGVAIPGPSHQKPMVSL